jgi:hypothetical protein
MQCYAGPGRANGAPAGNYATAIIANSADNTAHSCSIRSVYEALTPIGKDCAKIGQNSIERAFGATNAGLI